MTGREQLAAAMLGLHIIEIDGSGIDQGRTYVDKKTQATKPLPGRQTGYLSQGDRYPIKISVDILDGNVPYRPGLYLMSGALFGTGDFERVTFKGTRNLVLIELADAARALAELVAAETGEVIPLKTGTK